VIDAGIVPPIKILKGVQKDWTNLKKVMPFLKGKGCN
jgi:hypothetical protein